MNFWKCSQCIYVNLRAEVYYGKFKCNSYFLISDCATSSFAFFFSFFFSLFGYQRLLPLYSIWCTYFSLYLLLVANKLSILSARSFQNFCPCVCLLVAFRKRICSHREANNFSFNMIYRSNFFFIKHRQWLFNWLIVIMIRLC